MVDFNDIDIPNKKLREAIRIEKKRSPQARASDGAKKTGLTDDLEKWKGNPRRFDFPGIDVPEKDRLDVLK